MLHCDLHCDYFTMAEITNKEIAIILIDFQNDFCPSGSLAVKDADKAIPEINKLIAENTDKHLFLTFDAHPDKHASFASTHGAAPFTVKTLELGDQVMWPDHCVKGTKGYDLHPEIVIGHEYIKIEKGTLTNVDSYSGFGDAFDRKFEDTGLHAKLQSLGIKKLICVGLATDYCVKATVLDGIKLGYKVEVVSSCIKAVNATDGDGDKAIAEMKAAGAVFWRDAGEFWLYN